MQYYERVLSTLGGWTSTRAYIGGEWVDGEGGSYEIVNPATEEIVGHAPQVSVGQALATPCPPRPMRSSRGRARRPSTGRSCSTASPTSSTTAFDELVPLVTRPRPAPPCASPRPCRCPRSRRGSAATPPGALESTIESRSSRRSCRRPRSLPAASSPRVGAPRPGRRRELHHVVQLPDREHGRQDRPGPRHGQHGRGEAGAPGSARRDRAGRRCSSEAGFPPGVRQRRDRHRHPAVRGAGRRSPHVDMVVVHRLDRRRPAHRRGRRRRDEAPAAGARRQGRLHRLRRRRPEGRHRRHRIGVGLPLRPDLHRADPGHRAARRSRPARRRAARRPPGT